MRFKDLWRFLRRQRASYWLLCLYLFFEYVRPQSIYESIKGWPFSFWTILICGAVFLLEGARFRRLVLADVLLIGYLLMALASSATAYEPSWAFSHLNSYYTWVVIYLLITNIIDTEPRLLFFLLTYFLWNAKMSQFGFRGWAAAGFGFKRFGVTCAPGFFQNSGECGIEMAMVLPIAMAFLLALRHYWPRWKQAVFLLFPLSIIATIVGSSSRGAVLGLAALGLWLVLKSKRRVQALIAIAVLTVAVWAVVPAAQKQRFASMGQDASSVDRLTYWGHAVQMMDQHPMLGIGFDNWLPYYRDHYDPTGLEVHNIFLQAGSELGFPGLLLFVVMILSNFWVNRETRRMAGRLGAAGRFSFFMAHSFDAALVAYLVTGFFVTVLYYPFFWINLAFSVSLRETTRRKLRVVQAALAGPERRRGWSGSIASSPVAPGPV